MKNKAGVIALVLSILCICLTGVLYFWSFSIIKEADEQISILESEIHRIEGLHQEKETFDTESIETGKEKQTINKSESNAVETVLTEMQMETESSQTNGYTVAIDPGHQGSWVNMSELEPSAPGSSEMKAKATTGTAGMYTGIPEYQLNLDISLALCTELEKRGYTVVMTRTDNDTAISNAERAVKAYQEGGDIYVRIHANGSEDTSICGALGMTPSYDNAYVGYLAEDSYRLTECILNAYCAETGFKNLGIQYHDDMTGINWSQIPVTILEMGFMTNESDDAAMADKAVREKMVAGIANGIDQYFGR